MRGRGEVTDAPSVEDARWVAAILLRRPPGCSNAELSRLRRAADSIGLELHVIGGPHHGGATGPPMVRTDADRREVRAVLAALADRGIGAGIIGVLGRLPGLPARVHRLPGGRDPLRTAIEDQRQLRLQRRVPALDEDPGWTLRFDQVDAVLERVEESLLTVADGCFGTRGALEEEGRGSDPLVVAAGVYTAGVPGPVEETPTLLSAPTWTGLELGPGSFEQVERTLDLRTGLVLRTSPDPAGGPDLRVLRLACLERPGTALLWAEGPASQLAPGQPLAGADDRRVPSRAGRARAAVTSPVGRIEVETVDEVSDAGDRRILVRTVSLDRTVAPLDRALPSDAAPRNEGTGAPARDGAAPTRSRIRRAGPAGPVGTPEQLVGEQRAAWARRWSRADVEIDGDPSLQLAVRTGLYHLMGSVADRGEAAVGARGVTGRAYRGHVFWDADVFVLPFLAATHPASAEAMLAYRVARLPAACRAAAAAGRQGARFPWESAHDGRDVTPTSVPIGDRTRIPVTSGRYQEHITADVAWAAGHYLDWTGDRRFERGPGRALLFETARYWSSRVAYGADGRAHLREVMGPDEYHAPVDDNAYTNGLARWNLRRAAGLVEPSDPVALRREASAWRHLAELLVDGYDPTTGSHEQFTGFGDLADPPSFPTGPPVAADLLFGAERVAATRVIKQADVLMLHHLLPGALPRGSLARDLDRYLPLTAHGSSLSPAIHASVLARAGRPDEALDLLRLAAEVDLRDLSGSAAGGVHLAAAGSVWQALAYGFLGLWPERRGLLEIDPHLPKAWTSLGVKVTFRGRPLTVRADHRAVTITGDGPLRVRLAGRTHTVVPPRTVLRLDDGTRPAPTRRQRREDRP